MVKIVAAGEDWYEPLPVESLRFPIFVEGKEIEGVSSEEICEMLEKGKKITTSQVSVAQFLKTFQRIKDKEALCLCLASSLSGTYSNAVKAAKLVKGKKIIVVDSGTGSVALGYLAKIAAELAGKGKKIEEIARTIEKEKEKIKIYALIENMEYVARSGRLPEIVGKLGKFLKISTIISLKNNKISLEKILLRKPVESFLNFLKGREAIAVAASDLEGGRKISEALSVPITTLGVVFTAHLGRTIAVLVKEA